MICPECGKEMIWDSDATFKDAGFDGEWIIHFYHCTCGAEAEIYKREGGEEKCEH